MDKVQKTEIVSMLLCLCDFFADAFMVLVLLHTSLIRKSLILLWHIYITIIWLICIKSSNLIKLKSQS